MLRASFQMKDLSFFTTEARVSLNCEALALFSNLSPKALSGKFPTSHLITFKLVENSFFDAPSNFTPPL